MAANQTLRALWRDRFGIDAPRKIICVGLNYRDHAEEGGREPPDEPMLFAKFASALLEPGSRSCCRARDSHFDSEAELAVVIGRGGRRLAPEAALEHVAGFTVANDVSARNLQRKDKQWLRAKGFDTFCPLLPTLVSVDELGDASGLRIRQRLNGETLQDGNTRDLIFGVPQLVAHASSVFTLEPGDLISPARRPGWRLPRPAALDAGRRPSRDRDRADRRAREPGAGRMSAIDWLLESDEPAVRYLTRRDLLGEDALDDAAHILDGPKVKALFAGQQPDGGFGYHPYTKFGGAHWRLVSLVELTVPPGEPRALAALETVLTWFTSPGRAKSLTLISGLFRRCASMEGNALASPRGSGSRTTARRAARALARRVAVARRRVELRQEGERAKLVLPRVAAHDVGTARVRHGDGSGVGARRRGAPPRCSSSTGSSARSERGRCSATSGCAAPAAPTGTTTSSGLLILGRMGRVTDSRAADALEVLESLRAPDGRWAARGYWWKLGDGRANSDVVDWGRRGPNELLTLNALRVFAAAENAAPSHLVGSVA